MTKKQVVQQLQQLYNEQLNSFFYKSVNRDDPLHLFQLKHINQSGVRHKGEFIALKQYGYLIRVMTNVSPSDINKAQKLYDEVHSVLKNYSQVVAFAPCFYTVENSKKFQEDVQWIVLLSTIVLLIIYYLLIKNLRLLSQALIALFSSMLFATFVCTYFIENFNLLSLAFGMSLTAVSIDYLLHYHFHNFYANSKKIDTNVLYGYLTTVVAFAIFSFIPIPLIAQISSFAVLSLSFAYLLFTFVFPKLKLSAYDAIEQEDDQQKKKKIPASFILLLSLGLLIYSGKYFSFDSNIKHLDYQNIALRNAQSLFQNSNENKLHPIIVQAPSLQTLLSRLHQIQKIDPDSFSLASFVKDQKSCQKRKKELQRYDFQRLKDIINIEAPKIGFKEKYFDNAYKFTSSLPPCNVRNITIFQTYGLSLYHKDATFYTIAFVSDTKVFQGLQYVSDINMKEMFRKTTQNMVADLLLYGLVVLMLILLLLFLSVKQRFIYTINYILFPIAFTLAILVTLGTLNIMHLFSLIILIAIGIDYGIYMSNSKKVSHTMLAIKYSLLSTFAAFGVLIFSSIAALHSIGVVITLGCGAIFLLIKVMK